jgi:hypothetical protein
VNLFSIRTFLIAIAAIDQRADHGATHGDDMFYDLCWTNIMVRKKALIRQFWGNRTHNNDILSVEA